MSIFGIGTLALLVGGVAFLVGFGIWCESYNSGGKSLALVIAIAVAVSVGSTFCGIAIAQEQERIWIAEYEAQKATIEESIEAEELDGLERFELVKTAIELNRELSERKTKANRWHQVYYDNTLYDNVKPIKFK